VPDGPAFSLKPKTKEITEAAIRTTRIVILGYDIGVQQPLGLFGFWGIALNDVSANVQPPAAYSAVPKIR
jgi:hypothetical protein